MNAEEAIRDALKRDTRTDYRLSVISGVDITSINRFRNGGALRFTRLESLGRALGIEIKAVVKAVS